MDRPSDAHPPRDSVGVPVRNEALQARRLHVRVLLDTGPTDEEVRELQAAFSDLDMNAVVEGHSYGGPPPSSAFLVVVNAPLIPFLDSFGMVGRDGVADFERLVRRLLAMRADERQWGRPHSLKLEDAYSSLGILVPPDLPSGAIQALLEVDLSGFDRGSPPVTVEWSRYLHRWQGRLSAVSRRVARRLPSRSRTADQPLGVRELSGAEIRELWRLTDNAAIPGVTWRRAEIVLWSAVGWSVPAIVSKTLMSEHRVRAVIQNFNGDGFASLLPHYQGGQGVKLTPEEEREASDIASRPPTDYGLAFPAWEETSLAEFLVTEGVVEDVETQWLGELLRELGVGTTG